MRSFGASFAISLLTGLDRLPPMPFLPSVAPRRSTGPGRKTLYTVHKMIGRSKYEPHQGKRECARRIASKQRETA